MMELPKYQRVGNEDVESCAEEISNPMQQDGFIIKVLNKEKKVDIAGLDENSTVLGSINVFVFLRPKFSH